MLIMYSSYFSSNHYREKKLHFILLYKGVIFFVANSSTEMGLLYSKATYRSRQGFKLFWGRVSPSPPEKNIFSHFLFETEIENSGVEFSPSQFKCP